MKNSIIISFFIILIIVSCNPEDLISEFGDAVISAKSKVGEVLNNAKQDFAQDAKLGAIYGFNVNSEGQINLQKPTENAFVYIVQSDSAQSNEFYVPVYKSSPIKSPINFNTMLSFVKNIQAKNVLEKVFGTLSTVHIEASVSYDDSPGILNKMFSRNDVITFRTTNPGSKTDMFLVPAKSIDSLSLSSSAD